MGSAVFRKDNLLKRIYLINCEENINKLKENLKIWEVIDNFKCDYVTSKDFKGPKDIEFYFTVDLVKKESALGDCYLFAKLKEINLSNLDGAYYDVIEIIDNHISEDNIVNKLLTYESYTVKDGQELHEEIKDKLNEFLNNLEKELFITCSQVYVDITPRSNSQVLEIVKDRAERKTNENKKQ